LVIPMPQAIRAPPVFTYQISNAPYDIGYCSPHNHGVAADDSVLYKLGTRRSESTPFHINTISFKLIANSDAAITDPVLLHGYRSSHRTFTLRGLETLNALHLWMTSGVLMLCCS
jgi:hypothetical protein